MNQYKRLASNTIIFAVGSFGSKILLLFLTKLYTANLNPGDMSTKDLLEQTANFLIPIISCSITDAIIRYGLDRMHNRRKVFSTAYAIFGIGLVVLFASIPLLKKLPYTDGFIPLLLFYVIASSMRSINSQFVRARGMVKLFACDGIFATLTLFIFNLIFVGIFNLGITGFMMSVICSDSISALLLWVIADLKKFFSKKYIDRKMMKMMFRFSLPLIPTTILWLITEMSDRLFLRYMDGPSGLVGDSAAGIYGVSTKLPNLVSMISTIFYQAWNMSAILENNSTNRSKFYKNVFSSYQSFLFIAGAFLIVFVKPLSNMLIDSTNYPEYAQAYKYAPILIIAVIMMCLNQFFGSIYSATQHTAHSFWTSLVSAVVNIILNILLIRQFGIIGAVIATFSSYFASYIIRVNDARRYVPFFVDHTKFVLNLLALFFMSFTVVNEPKGWVPILVMLSLFVLLYNFRDLLRTILKLKKRR